MDVWGNLDREDVGWGPEPDPTLLIIAAVIVLSIIGIIDYFIKN